jgi:SAM-dependent methyltransferase
MINDPVIFHLHHMKETEDIIFWTSLAEKTGGPILELGCGTGRLLVPLIEDGHRVIGLDIKYPALAYLRDSLNETMRDHIQVFQSSMEQFQLDINFSLVFLACNTLSTLKGESRVAAYKVVYKHLHPLGIFAASFPNPAHLESLPTKGDAEIEETLVHPATGNPIQVFSSWERSKATMIFRWHYDQLLPDGRVSRDTVETEHHLVSLDQYVAELKAERLNPIQILGDYNHSDYDLFSPYVIVIARKEA